MDGCVLWIAVFGSCSTAAVQQWYSCSTAAVHLYNSRSTAVICGSPFPVAAAASRGFGIWSPIILHSGRAFPQITQHRLHLERLELAGCECNTLHT